MLILRLCVLLLVLVPVSVQALVIETNEWTSLVRAGWAHNAPPTIDNATNTPAGGGALRGICNAGTYSSSLGCGRSEYTLSGAYTSLTELYVGHWIKWSSPFDWQRQGTKFDYLVTRDLHAGTGSTGYDNFMLMVGPNGVGMIFTQQLQMTCATGPCTKSFSNNIASFNPQRNVWYWMEYHAKMNTLSTYGNPDGLIEVWVNDVLVMRHTNVTLRNSNTPFSRVQHSNEWGGNGGTINQTQYIWNDHTVISTGRIGTPGGVQVPTDTTNPTAPSSLVAQ